MSIITIDETWSIEPSEHCWIVHRKSTHIATRSAKAGEEVTTTVETYHANIRQVIRHVLDKEAGRAVTLRKILVRLSEIEDKLEAVFNAR